MVVYASLQMGMDLAPGLEFYEEVRRTCFSTVHPTKDSGHFTLVVSFVRTSFKLTEDSAAVALESITGGRCDALKVSILRDRVFSFTVSNKKVGFLLTGRRKFVSPQSICYFYLWNYGGPQWQYEFKRWQKQCNEECTLVSPPKKRLQAGLNALRSFPKKSAMKDGPPKGKSLRFSTIIDYDACKSYNFRVPLEVRKEIVDA